MNDETTNDADKSMGHNTTQAGTCCPMTRTPLTSLVTGLILGIIITALGVWTFMPGMMINQHESRLDFDATVATLEQAIVDQGWQVQRIMDINKSLAEHDRSIPVRAKVIKLCQPQYAEKVVANEPHIACLMPCSIAVYETPDGNVHISQMNTGLMGKMFGGVIAEVMGGSVAADEEHILSSVLK